MRGYLVMFAHLIPPQRATDPSPGPRRLVKTPVVVHPLPRGEGVASVFIAPRAQGAKES